MLRKKRIQKPEKESSDSTRATVDQFIVSCREQLEVAFGSLDAEQQEVFAQQIETILTECRTRYQRFLKRIPQASQSLEPQRTIYDVLGWLPGKMSHDRYRAFMVSLNLPAWAVPDLATFNTDGTRARWEELEMRGITEGARVMFSDSAKVYIVDVILLNCLVGLKGVTANTEPSELTVIECEKAGTV